MSLDTLQNKGEASLQTTRRSFVWLLPVGLLVGFIVILALLFGDRFLPATEVQTAPVVTLRGDSDNPQAAQGSMLFQASGWIEPDPYVTYVPALINGIVNEVHVLEGQEVKKGQLLASLIDDDEKLKLAAAQQKHDSMEKRIHAHCQSIPILEAQIAAVNKKVEAGKSLLAEERDNYKRLEKLGGDAVSQQRIVQAKYTVARNEATVAQFEAEIPELTAKMKQINAERESMEASLSELKTMRDQAALALKRTEIHAPHDGVVLHLHVAPGKKRMLNMDDPKSSVIVELYDPNSLQARIDVPLTEAAGLGVGQRVEMVSDLLSNTTFHGKVTRISGQADLQRNTLQAKVSIEKPDRRLRPDMLVRAKFYTAPAQDGKESEAGSGRLTLFVPEQAIVNDGQVWVVSTEGKAELRTLELGSEKRENHRSVLSGVRSGEQVILAPSTSLSEGDRLTTNKN